MLSIDINDAGQAVLCIADAEGELHGYRFRLLPPGYFVFVLEVTRGDTEATYRVELEDGQRWTCDCPAETYRKRGKPHCKHIEAGKAYRAFLRSQNLEAVHDRSNRVRSAS